MKKVKQIALWTLGTFTLAIPSTLFIYLSLVLINWDFNASNWNVHIQIYLGLMALISVIVGAAVTYATEEMFANERK